MAITIPGGLWSGMHCAETAKHKMGIMITTIITMMMESRVAKEGDEARRKAEALSAEAASAKQALLVLNPQM